MIIVFQSVYQLSRHSANKWNLFWLRKARVGLVVVVNGFFSAVVVMHVGEEAEQRFA